MKKIVLLITILFISVLTTACINNLAVQELNNKAKEYINNGDTETAICRLKSSLDLDSNMYETHYNLAVAYIASKNYEEAIKSLEQVRKLNPDFADTYYSVAVVREEEGYAIINGEPSQPQQINGQTVQEAAPVVSEKRELTQDDKKLICDKFTEAIQYYNEYLTKKLDATDKNEVNEKINLLNTEIKKYNISESANMEQ